MIPVGSGFNVWAHAVVVYEGDLIAAGNFTEAGGVRVNPIATVGRRNLVSPG
jgi:hypothetical protein